jgi:hypothetical protein
MCSVTCLYIHFQDVSIFTWVVGPQNDKAHKALNLSKESDRNVKITYPMLHDRITNRKPILLQSESRF